MTRAYVAPLLAMTLILAIGCVVAAFADRTAHDPEPSLRAPQSSQSCDAGGR